MPPEAVSVTPEPGGELQITGGLRLEVMVIVGVGTTVTRTDAVAVHTEVEETVTVYWVVTDGVAIGLGLLALLREFDGDQLTVVPPV